MLNINLKRSWFALVWKTIYIMKTRKVTLKGFVNVIDIKPQFEAIKKQYPDYKEKPIVAPSDYKGSDKVYIYGYYWNGEWSAPVKQCVETLYKPKTV